MPLERRLPLIATATFLAGFGVAELTGVRAIGGLVLLAGGYWCAREALPAVGRGPTVAMLVGALILFVIAHPLGHAIGAWPAVFITAAAAGLLVASILWRNRHAPPPREVGRAMRAGEH